LAAPWPASANRVIGGTISDGEGSLVETGKARAQNVPGDRWGVCSHIAELTSHVLGGRFNKGQPVTDEPGIALNGIAGLAQVEPEIRDVNALDIKNSGVPTASEITPRVLSVPSFGEPSSITDLLTFVVHDPFPVELAGDPKMGANACNIECPGAILKTHKVPGPSSLTLLSVGLILVSLSMRHQCREMGES